MYQHKQIRFNYTTYDVRRAQDVINPRTSHCNIMVLSHDSDDNGSTGNEQKHKFWYARVLGIYHANVVYVGPGMVDYMPKRLDFLWVRWYQYMSRDLGHASGWSTCKLHKVYFPPMSTDNSFGFLDPADVLRGCHIIPDFFEGRRYQNRDGGLSGCANDYSDWKQYYVGQYASFCGINCDCLTNKLA
jgi:hypothetical protein